MTMHYMRATVEDRLENESRYLVAWMCAGLEKNDADGRPKNEKFDWMRHVHTWTRGKWIEMDQVCVDDVKARPWKWLAFAVRHTFLLPRLCDDDLANVTYEHLCEVLQANAETGTWARVLTADECARYEDEQRVRPDVVSIARYMLAGLLGSRGDPTMGLYFGRTSPMPILCEWVSKQPARPVRNAAFSKLKA